MKEYQFSDDQLEAYVENSLRDMTSLERQLAFTIQKDRETFAALLKEIEPMAAQIVSPKDNTFNRQVDLIKSRIPLSS